MKFILFVVLSLFSFSCYSVEQKQSVQSFLKDYYSSNERNLWPETIYAIEKNYDYELIVYCLNKFGLQSPLYLSRDASVNLYLKNINWNDGKDKTPVDIKNALITSFRNDRLNVFELLMQIH